MVRDNFNKNAFTLIELIFAIVIIAISVMSLPMMTQRTSTAIEENIIQEAIFAASAQLNEATTYTWDENSTNDSTISTLSRVINTNDDDCNASGNRPGNINRNCLSNLATRPLDAAIFGGTSINSIAYAVPKSIYIAGATPSKRSYKNDYNSTLVVTRCSAGCTQFGNEATNKSLKQLVYTIFDPNDGSTLVLLRAYSANIGELEPVGNFL